jgi:hypothetical protein
VHALCVASRSRICCRQLICIPLNMPVARSCSYMHTHLFCLCCQRSAILKVLFSMGVQQMMRGIVTAAQLKHMRQPAARGAIQLLSSTESTSAVLSESISVCWCALAQSSARDRCWLHAIHLMYSVKLAVLKSQRQQRGCVHNCQLHIVRYGMSIWAGQTS